MLQFLKCGYKDPLAWDVIGHKFRTILQTILQCEKQQKILTEDNNCNDNKKADNSFGVIFLYPASVINKEQ